MKNLIIGSVFRLVVTLILVFSVYVGTIIGQKEQKSKDIDYVLDTKLKCINELEEQLSSKFIPFTEEEANNGILKYTLLGIQYDCFYNKFKKNYLEEK